VRSYSRSIWNSQYASMSPFVITARRSRPPDHPATPMVRVAGVCLVEQAVDHLGGGGGQRGVHDASGGDRALGALGRSAAVWGRMSAAVRGAGVASKRAVTVVMRRRPGLSRADSWAEGGWGVPSSQGRIACGGAAPHSHNSLLHPPEDSIDVDETSCPDG
jgi:hypothetical protein